MTYTCRRPLLPPPCKPCTFHPTPTPSARQAPASPPVLSSLLRSPQPLLPEHPRRPAHPAYLTRLNVPAPCRPVLSRVLAHPGHHPLHHLPPGKPPPHTPSLFSCYSPGPPEHPPAPAPRARLFIRRRPISRRQPTVLFRISCSPRYVRRPSWPERPPAPGPCCLGTRPTLSPRRPASFSATPPHLPAPRRQGKEPPALPALAGTPGPA